VVNYRHNTNELNSPNSSGFHHKCLTYILHKMATKVFVLKLFYQHGLFSSELVWQLSHAQTSHDHSEKKDHLTNR
jgi:hypothetical protein